MKKLLILVAAGIVLSVSAGAQQSVNWTESDRTHLVTEVTRSRDELIRETKGLPNNSGISGNLHKAGLSTRLLNIFRYGNYFSSGKSVRRWSAAPSLHCSRSNSLIV